MPPNTLGVHTECVLVKSGGPKVLWVVAAETTSAGDLRIFPFPPVPCLNCGGGDRWCRHLSYPTRGLLATDHVILNHGQVTWTTPELAPPLLTTTPHQREDVSALDRFNVHRCPTRRVFSGTGIELVTRRATIRYLYLGWHGRRHHEGKWLRQHPFRTTRRLLVMNLVILNHGQGTRMAPQLAPVSPNYQIIPTGGRLSSRQI
ncbi:uncharacterized protein TNCV_188221 [Trichonephila clavipes]|nr:uncharacterized protein TNCV_188221 [Trichonephila clavipes]